MLLQGTFYENKQNKIKQTNKQTLLFLFVCNTNAEGITTIYGRAVLVYGAYKYVYVFRVYFHFQKESLYLCSLIVSLRAQKLFKDDCPTYSYDY